jgi:hypothetical protein
MDALRQRTNRETAIEILSRFGENLAQGCVVEVDGVSGIGR